MQVFWRSLLLLALLSSYDILAQDLVQTSGTTFLTEKAKSRRVGLEVELRNMTVQDAARQIAMKLGGSLKKKSEHEYLIEGTHVGDVRVYLDSVTSWRKPNFFGVPDEQAHWSDPYLELWDKYMAPVEIVSPPMSYDQMLKFDEAIRSFPDAGAKGTSGWRAVSTQVNVELFPPGTDPKSPENIKLATALLQNYYEPEHERQVLSVLAPPKIRREYILPVTEDFRKRLLSPDYKPTAEDLHFDYLYRQAYSNLIGDPVGKSSEEIRSAVLALPDVDKKSAKFSRLQMASALIYAVPEEPLSKKIADTGWNKPRPAVEFREPNTDFNVKGTVDWALGLVEASETHGHFDHDVLMSKLSGLKPVVLEELRENSRRKGLRIVRYEMASDPYSENTPRGRRFWNRLYERLTHGNQAEIYELPEQGGVAPVQIRGESVVWHRRHIHKGTILGKYNPALVNDSIQEAMENKLFEAKVFQKYVPESFPRTVSVDEVSKTGASGASPDALRKLKTDLDAAFPEGWVLKGAYDYNTGKDFIISNKDDFAKLSQYVSIDWEERLQKLREARPDLDYEHFLNELKASPEFKGYLLSAYLKEPHLVLAQSRMNIIAEYRVEMIEGKILSDSSILDRGFRSLPAVQKTKTALMSLLGSETEDKRLIKEAVKAWFDRLPEHFRKIPYGLDVAIVDENGKRVAKLIETNPGGNSGFLAGWRGSSQALNRYLRDYVARSKKGKAYTGLSGARQMEILKAEISDLGLKEEVHFPGLEFRADDLVDPALCIKTQLQ